MGVDLTHEEARQLVLNLARTRDEAGFTEAEGCLVIDWARQTKLATRLLELVLSGEVGISVKDGEVVYHGHVAQKLRAEMIHA